MVEFNNDWDELLKDEFKKEYYLRLRQFLINEYRTQRIFRVCMIFSMHLNIRLMTM